MRIALPLLAAGFVWGLGAQSSTAPSYSTAGIVNSATFTADALAPNTIASIYGTGLSFDTRAVTSADIVNGMLPRVLAGVRVLIDNRAVPLYYVSPKQINFQIPSNLLLGDTDLFVAPKALLPPEHTCGLRCIQPDRACINRNLESSHPRMPMGA